MSSPTSRPGQIGVYFNSGPYRLLGTLFFAPEEGPRPTAVILHGLPGIEKNYDLAHMLRDNGWHSLIFHYRGCWGSQGAYQLTTIPQDVQAAVDYLTREHPGEVDPTRLILIGHSMSYFWF